MLGQITLDRCNYDTKERFFTTLANQIQVLMDNDYICTVKKEDCDYYTITYDFDDTSLGGSYPYWLSSEESEELENCIRQKNNSL